VVEINGQPLEALIYRGGHDDTWLELISSQRLAHQLSLASGQNVVMTLVEFSAEGEAGMPGPPPSSPGKTV
jgi:hypothetical protein